MPLSDIEQRIRGLEAHQEIQEAILIAMQAERIEAERLTDSVDRLGMGATALGEAILQVDRNQQTLTKLGGELREVKSLAATKEDHAKALVELHKVRRTRNLMIWAIGGVIVMGTLTGLYLNEQQQEEAYKACVSGKATGAAVQTFLTTVAENSTTPAVKKSATDLVNAFNGRPVQAECEKP